MKRYRYNQSRAGNPERRQLEFDIVRYHVRRRKQDFIAYLQSKLTVNGDCLEFGGKSSHVKGYARFSLWYDGRQNLTAHTVFMILQLCTPIPLGYEVDHTCKNRRCVKHLRLLHYTDNARGGAETQNAKNSKVVLSGGTCII